MMKKNEEPKPIKVTKNEAEAFQKLVDRKIAITQLLEQYGLEERLLWEGLKEKYNIGTLSHTWVYDKEKKTLEISYKNPSWAKERLMK